MNATVRPLVLLACLAILAAGCASPKEMCMEVAPEIEVAMLEADVPASKSVQAGDVARDRMLAWKASLSIEVADVTNAALRAVALAEQNGGYIESRSDSSYSGTALKLRLPAPAFTNAIGALEALGKVTSRRVENEDVTEQYVDVEARL